MKRSEKIKLIREATKSVLRAELGTMRHEQDITVTFNEYGDMMINGYGRLNGLEIEEIEKEWDAVVFIHEWQGLRIMLTNPSIP
jgi:hypothetical protein